MKRTISARRFVWPSGYLKTLIFASVCAAILFPSMSISFMQQKKLAEEAVDRLALELATISYQDELHSLSPELAVSMLQNNKLVMWAKYFRNGIVVARSGIEVSVKFQKGLRQIDIAGHSQVAKQILRPKVLNLSEAKYRLHLALGKFNNEAEALEVGISYAPVYTLIRDLFALFVVLFITAFIFLLGTLIFVDTHLSYFVEKIALVLENRRDLDSTHPLTLPGIGLESNFYLSNFDNLMKELEQREDQLISTKDTLQAIFDGLLTGVIMLSADKKVVLVNKYILEIFGGISTSDLVGQGLSVFESGHERLAAIVDRLLSTLSFQTEDVEIEAQGGGGRRSYACTAHLLRDKDKGVIAIIVQYSDITNEKKAQDTLQNFNQQLTSQLNVERKKLEESNKQLLQSSKLAAVGELAGGVAHEINNPNGVIIAGAQYVLGRLRESEATNPGVIPDYVEKYMTRIVKQATRISEIVSGLLAFSRRKSAQKGEFDILAAIHDAVELVRPRFIKNKINFRLEGESALPAIWGNANELSQVFLNLANNAVDAMEELGGGDFVVDVLVENDKQRMGENEVIIKRWIVLHIHNSGPNIAPDIIDKVMEPFFTTKPIGKGTGLGLSVSHGIVADHGGEMRVYNASTGGPVFEIKLPAVS